MKKLAEAVTEVKVFALRKQRSLLSKLRQDLSGSRSKIIHYCVSDAACWLSPRLCSKDLWLCDRELEMAWPACGLPELLHLDNAPEFRSEALERGTREYGINLLYRPIGRPHFGGHIEPSDDNHPGRFVPSAASSPALRSVG